jgi:hypothetical protein
MNVAVFPSPKAAETLQLELSLLQVLHHRNKNQLHSQPFYKHLSILRRTLNLLLENPQFDFLLQKLRQTVIPHGWDSFSRMVARGEFVTLALVLCTSIAQVVSCLRGVEEISVIEDDEEFREDVGELVHKMHEVERVVMQMDEMGEGEWMETHRSAESAQVPFDPPAEIEFEETTAPIRVAEEETTIGEIERPTKRRKKKKAKDDIDKLFAGFV